MRILLTALLISIAASNALAQTVVSEEWSTYCDGGIEKVRVAITLRVLGPIFDENTGAEIAAYEPDCLTTSGCGNGLNGARTEMGNNEYRWVWQGFLRSCFGTETNRFAGIGYAVNGPFGLEYRLFIMPCSDGPQTIIDESDCQTLPVRTSTWGAIKALYRS